MIWYRHWLEIRSRLPALALVLLLAAWPGMGLNGATSFEQTGRVFREVVGTPLAQSIEMENLFVWATFAERIPVLAWVAAFCLAGSVFGRPPRDLSVYYTLSLPVSRRRLIWTRQMAGFAVALLVSLLMLAVQCAILLFQGRDIPFSPLITSLAFGLPVLMAWIAVMGAVNLVMNEFWALLAVSPLLLLSLRFGFYTVTAFPARGDLPWDSMSALVAITALCVTFSISWGPNKEF
jgi:hypothetical protein